MHYIFFLFDLFFFFNLNKPDKKTLIIVFVIINDIPTKFFLQVEWDEIIIAVEIAFETTYERTWFLLLPTDYTFTQSLK